MLAEDGRDQKENIQIKKTQKNTVPDDHWKPENKRLGLAIWVV